LVDEVLGLVLDTPGFGHHCARDVAHGDPAGFPQFNGGEKGPEEFLPFDAFAIPQFRGDPRRSSPGIQDVHAGGKDPRIGIGMAKPPRVVHDADIQRVGHTGSEGNAQFPEYVVDDNRRGRRFYIQEMERRKRELAGMMVEAKHGASETTDSTFEAAQPFPIVVVDDHDGVATMDGRQGLGFGANQDRATLRFEGPEEFRPRLQEDDLRIGAEGAEAE
jgi:hypothetical protein